MATKYINTVLITGGTQGIGYECALSIARQHPEYQIIISARSDKQNAVASLNNQLATKNVIFLPIDLGNLADVRRFADEYKSKSFPPLKALVLNAGMMSPGPYRKTVDGYEAHFGVNHVGHAMLFHLLFDQLAADARVVITASGTHDPAQKTGVPDAKYTTAEELAQKPTEDVKDAGMQRYSTSKLVNVLWSYALARRLEKLSDKHISVLTFDPGVVPNTGLLRESGTVIRFLAAHLLPKIFWLLRLFMGPNVHTPKESGGALARLAIGKDVEGVSGKYFEGRKEIMSSAVSYDVGKQEDIWAWTVRACAKDDEERRRFDIAA